MKKFKMIAYILLIVVVVVLSLTIYSNATKDNQNSTEEKIVSETKYIESKLIDLFNTMNNIEYNNYNVETNNVSTQASDQGTGGSSSGEGGGSSSGSSQEGESSSGQGGSSSSSGEQTAEKSEQTEEETKKFDLKASGVLTNKEDINWDSVKSEVEILYSSIPTLTLDLYQLNVNQDDILGFNKEFDNLTVAAKDEKKEETLSSLSKLYDYMAKFVTNTSQDEVSKKLIEIKSNVLKAYSKLDSGDWTQIENDINNASNLYSNLLTNTNISSNKQYSINKCYVMLNEMKNAVTLKDESVFLIKYKNLLEEINKI